YHRRSRGPRIAPTNAQRPTMTPYQSAMNGMESSGQWKAYATAPNAPATSPATAPVRLKLVGAPWRKAQTTTANGIVAKSGMQNTHITQSVPITICPQAAEG